MWITRLIEFRADQLVHWIRRPELIFGAVIYLNWLWRRSGAISFGKGLRAWVGRLRFVQEGFRVRAALRPFREAPVDGVLGRAVRDRPELLEAVIRPYQTTAWDAPTRLDKLCRHFERVNWLDWPQLSDPDGAIHIMPLDEVRVGLRLVLDQPMWFSGEGPLVLNLFLDDTRLYSLAFALGNEDALFTARVGAIQGRSLPGIMDIYRELTHAGHGLRPRDLMIEMFQMFCGAIGVERILLVSDSHRQHRGSYFAAEADKVVVDYDEIWSDRGARRIDDATFELPVNAARRGPLDIPARKRGLYRRRYALLDTLVRDGRRRIAAIRECDRRPAAHRKVSCAS